MKLFSGCAIAATCALAPAQVPAPADFTPCDLAISPDGSVIAACARSHRLYRFAGDELIPLPIESSIQPRRIAFAGDRLIVLDSRAHSVFSLDLGTGRATRIAGDGTPGSAGVRLSHPSGMAVDESGNVWIADTGNARIRRIDAGTGRLTTWLSASTLAARSIRSVTPADVAVARDGTVWVLDLARGCVVRCSSSGDPQLLRDTADRRNLNRHRIATHGDSAYVVESQWARIRKVDQQALEIFVAGDDGDEPLSWPTAIAFEPDGDAWIADAGAIRRLDSGTGALATAVRARPATGLEVVRETPDPAIVTDPKVRERIVATGRPWHVRDRASGVELLLVPPGEFLRGVGDGDDDVRGDATPAHRVTLTRPFYVGRYEVTNAQFRHLAPLHLTIATPRELDSFNDVTFDADDQPAATLCWFDANDFCRRFGFRLPSEAEWEYACRAGASTPYLWGDDVDAAEGQANLANPSLRLRTAREVHAVPFEDGHVVTAPIGSFRPNGFGLCDMIGNAWEWCADWYAADEYARCRDGAVDPTGPADGTKRVLRGSSWRCNFVGSTRLSFRGQTNPTATYTLQRGFRVVRDVDG